MYLISPQQVSWEGQDAVPKTLQEHKQDIASFIELAQRRILRHEHDSSLLLSAYISHWKELEKQCDTLARFFFDVQEGKRYQRMMLHKWNLAIFSKIQLKLLKCAIQLVQVERNGEKIDSKLVLGVQNTFEVLSSETDNLKYYRHNFEKAYIECAEEFYKEESYCFLLENGVKKYLKYVDDKIREEEQRAEIYLNVDHDMGHDMKRAIKYKELIMRSCVKVLVADHLDKILSLCAGMIEKNDAEGLRLMFKLTNLVPDGIAPMLQEFERSLHCCFSSDFALLASTTSIQFGERLLASFRKYNGLVDEAFSCDPGVIFAKENAYKRLINDQRFKLNYAENLANFCSVLLTKSAEESKLEKDLQECLLMFKYLDHDIQTSKVETMVGWLKKVEVPHEILEELIMMFNHAVLDEMTVEVIKRYQPFADSSEQKDLGKVRTSQYYNAMGSQFGTVIESLAEKNREEAITDIFMHLPRVTTWRVDHLQLLRERLTLLRECAPKESLEKEDVFQGITDFIDSIFHLKQLDILKHALDVLACQLTTSHSQRILERCFFEKWNAFHDPFPDILAYAGLRSWIEVVRLCVQCRAKVSSRMIQTMVSNIGLCNSNELIPYLDTTFLLLDNYRNEGNTDTVPCDLDVLSDLYMIKEEVRTLGNAIVSSAYGNLESCIDSDSIVNVLFYITSEQPSQPQKKLVEDTLRFNNRAKRKEKNWLQRNAFHLAAAILHNKHALEYIPEEMWKNCLNTRDLHGCTPLHLACMHHNKDGLILLESLGTKADAEDNFGVTPAVLRHSAHVVNVEGTLESNHVDYEGETFHHREHLDVLHQKVCQNVINAESGVLEALKPMLVISEQEAQMLGNDLKEVFRRIMAVTKYKKYVKKLVIAGSLREKCKVGRLDEADIQIRLVCDDTAKLCRKMHKTLVTSLSLVDWRGIYLRPISILNPWEFVWERPGPSSGLTVSVDVVPLALNVNRTDARLAYKTSLITGIYRQHPEALFLKWRKCTGWRTCAKKNSHKVYHFQDTCFAYDWDIIASLSPEERMGIRLAKALLEAYKSSTQGQRLGDHLPITSYMVKKVFFTSLNENTTPIVMSDEDEEEDDCDNDENKQGDDCDEDDNKQDDDCDEDDNKKGDDCDDDDNRQEKKEETEETEETEEKEEVGEEEGNDKIYEQKEDEEQKDEGREA